MSFLRNALRSNLSVRAFNTNQGRPLFLRESPQHFSTESEQPPAPDGSSIDSFLQNASSGMDQSVYGKLLGVSKYTLKTDIINFLEGCNLIPDDVKVIYNRTFAPVGMMIQFPSRHAFDNAFRVIGRNGRIYRLDKADRSQWEHIMPYDGKTVLLQGIPRNALVDDLERFLSGCEYDPTSIQVFLKQGIPDKLGLVRFHSETGAMNAFITKNRGFCLNNRVSLRILQ